MELVGKVIPGTPAVSCELDLDEKEKNTGPSHLEERDE